MIILSLSVGDLSHIGNNIKHTILENDGRQVRIGIDAPREVTVHREEVYLKIEAQGFKNEVNWDR